VNISIESNLAQLNASLNEYIKLSGRTVDEALRKQAAKLGFNLRKELRGIAPAKGSIRAQAEALLKSGRGIKVRESVLRKVFAKRGARSIIGSGRVVFGKKGAGSTRAGLNLWALAVQAEINLRESARGFLGVSATYRGLSSSLEQEAKAFSRAGPVLSTVDFKELSSGAGGSVEFLWGPAASTLSGEAAAGLTKAKGDAAINRALTNTLEDIEVYITRKLLEAW
jgi:hypothetical protein